MQSNAIEPEPLTGLNAFQRDALRAAEEATPCSGTELADVLEAHYGKVYNARIYPALEELADSEFLSIEDAGGANRYLITDDGRAALDAHRDWYNGELKA